MTWKSFLWKWLNPYGPTFKHLFVSLRSHKQLFRKAGSSPHKKPQLCCWRRPLMVRQPYSVAVWAPFLSPTRGTEGVVKTIERAVGTSLVPWGERLCKWAQWKFAFILPSAANLLHEKRGLGKAVEPSLMGKSGANERNESSLSNCRVQPALSKKEGELQKDSVWAKFAYTASDGKTYQVDYYNSILC